MGRWVADCTRAGWAPVGFTGRSEDWLSSAEGWSEGMFDDVVSYVNVIEIMAG